MTRAAPLLAIVLLALAGCATAPPSDIDNACKIFDEKGGWYKATRRAEKRWGLPKHIQLAIIGQESSFDRSAKPPRKHFLFVIPAGRKSSSRGYAQAVEGTWAQYQRDTGNSGASRKNFADSADFVAWYGRQSHRRNGVAMDDAYNQYLAYHEGWKGYAKGSYVKSRDALNGATAVARAAAIYRKQLDRCEKRFNKHGVPLIPFI